MENFFALSNDVCDIGETLQQYVNDIILSEKYIAYSQILRKHYQQRREIASTELEMFKKISDRTFQTAVKVLDLAIDSANPKLAEAACSMIKDMRKSYPEFYKNFVITLLT